MEDSRRCFRKKYIERRAALSAEEVDLLSKLAVERIVAVSAYRKASTVLVYSHVGNELSLDSLLAHPSSQGKRFAFPLCESGGEMKAMLPGGWKTGRFGIPEPDRSVSEEVGAEELDLVICPGTAFDSDCHRFGMGGGYYDRFLPLCRKAFVIMAAFEIQHAECVPFEEWDYPMDMVVTEKSTYCAGGSERRL